MNMTENQEPRLIARTFQVEVISSSNLLYPIVVIIFPIVFQLLNGAKGIVSSL